MAQIKGPAASADPLTTFVPFGWNLVLFGIDSGLRRFGPAGALASCLFQQYGGATANTQRRLGIGRLGTGRLERTVDVVALRRVGRGWHPPRCRQRAKSSLDERRAEHDARC